MLNGYSSEEACMRKLALLIPLAIALAAAMAVASGTEEGGGAVAGVPVAT